jgi:serine/threonine-protein kinase
MQHVQGELILPHQLNPKIPIGLSYVVMRALRKNPETRYDTAKEMAEAIRSVSEGLTNVYEAPDENLEGTRELNIQLAPPTKLPEPAPPRSRTERSKSRSDVADTDNRAPRGRERRPRINIGLIVILILVVGLIGAVVWAFTQLGVTPVDDRVEVPDVVGLNEDIARMLLEDVGLTARIQERNHEEVPFGEVMVQNPSAGMSVGEGREVILTVSGGPVLTVVPDLLGETQSIAEFRLRHNGLGYYFLEGEYNDYFPAGQIMEQEPIGGSGVAGGTVVFLKISLGPEPMPTTVPNMVGQTLAIAEAALAEAGLELAENVIRQESIVHIAGIVIAQSVSAGSEVNEGTEITLTVSDGPGPPVAQLSYSILEFQVPFTGHHQVRVVVEVRDEEGIRNSVDQYRLPDTLFREAIAHYGLAELRVYIDGNLHISRFVSNGGP